MNCYICKTELVPCTIVLKGKEIPADKCPKCNNDHTTLIRAKVLKELEAHPKHEKTALDNFRKFTGM